MNVAILGSSGYLGSAYLQIRAPSGIRLVPASRSSVNYHDPFILREFLRSEQIKGVINCAGFTGKPNVDACEDFKGLCFKLNVELPETIAKVCFDENMTLFQIGSGCIYQGTPDAENPDRATKRKMNRTSHLRILHAVFQRNESRNGEKNQRYPWSFNLQA